MIKPLQRSLKTRVTLFSLVIFVLSLWALAYYASKMLHSDMEQLLGDQQRSTVALVAANIDQELNDRLAALESIAGDFRDQDLESLVTLQGILERRPILPLLFNGGYFVTDAAGIITASVPVEAGRIGINHILSNHVATALGEGRSAIGAVMIGKALRVPVFNMAVPIRDAQGKVIGSLVGVINLSSDNFLDRITSNTYGRTGGYMLVSRQQRLIVTGTDKSRIMEALPPTGVRPEIDKHLAGYEGSGLLRNVNNMELLVSVKNIPVAGWYVAATLPTAEAFAPIDDMQQRMLLATILLTLIAGGLTWWILQRQLAPIAAAAAALGARPGQGLVPEPLPVTTQDEIGQLISSFNSLLDELATREQALKASENRFSLFMECLPGAAFIKDEIGTTLYANRYMMDVIGARAWQGKSTREIFPPEVAEKMIADDRRAMAAGHAVAEDDLPAADGRLRNYETHKFSIPRPGQAPLLGGIALDITERKQAEDALRRTVRDLGETQRIAHIGSWHLDLASNQVTWTEELYKMYGFDPSRPVPPYTEHMKLFTPESWDRLSSALAHTRETGIPYTLELETVRKDGNKGWMWVHGEVEVDSAGKTIGLWGAAQDITERKQAEQATVEALGRVDRLAQHVPGMLYQYHLRPDGTSHFPYSSSGIREIYGVMPEQVSHDAEAVFKVIHPDDLQRGIEGIQASARTLNDWHAQYRVKLPDGRTIWVEGEASPEAAPDGGVLWHGHIRDITERKATESRLHEQLDELHRWQQTMLGREDRIIKVKQEVNELLERSGLPPRYATQHPAKPGEGDA